MKKRQALRQCRYYISNMTFPRIIGIMGRSRMGKDTVASTFCELLGKENTTIYRMSRTLKEAVAVLYGYHPDEVEGPTKEQVDLRYGITPRNAIQGLCEYLMKRHGSDFFSKQVFAAYDNGAFHGKFVIIPDIRYEHDLAEIRSRGGIILKVARPYSLEVPCHAWETHIDQLRGDYEINNQGTIDDLRRRVVEVFNQISRNSAPLLPCLVKEQESSLVPLNASDK